LLNRVRSLSRQMGLAPGFIPAEGFPDGQRRRTPLFNLCRLFFTPPSLHKPEKTLGPVAVSHYLVGPYWTKVFFHPLPGF
jgi:hypothetical protein